MAPGGRMATSDAPNQVALHPTKWHYLGCFGLGGQRQVDVAPSSAEELLVLQLARLLSFQQPLQPCSQAWGGSQPRTHYITSHIKSWQKRTSQHARVRKSHAQGSSKKITACSRKSVSLESPFLSKAFFSSSSTAGRQGGAGRSQAHSSVF